MKVIARKGLDFKVQGKRVSDIKEALVNVDHNVSMLLRNGSLINIDAIKAQTVQVKPAPKPVPKPEPKKEEKSQEDKKI